MKSRQATFPGAMLNFNAKRDALTITLNKADGLAYFPQKGY